ncbi:MAG: hypothetical protein WC829_01315 [Hyphomicrobium sp.]|jgi:hypothetical protein
MNAPQLPAYLQNRASKGLAQSLVANLGVGSPPFLSIMGNRLTLIDSVGEEIPVSTYDPKIGPYLDCAIIDALERTSKIYYDKAFDPGANQYEPPACFSDNGIAPSRNAGKPQSPTCASCPQAAWGSKVSTVSGKGVKACNDVQKIAVLVPGYEMPFLVRVPPNSRTNFRGYVNKFVGQPIDVCDVLTRISFEPGGIGTLHFDAVGYIDEASFGQREKLMAAKATDAMIGRTDMPREGGALSAPAQAVAQIAPPVGQEQTAFVPQGMPQQAAPMQAAPMAQAAPAPQGRRRRSAAAEVPAQAQQAPQQAPFMPQQAAQPAPTGAQFGMQEGAAPNAALQDTLNNLFGKT